MDTIELDASNWRSSLDFYNSLLAAIGTPEWQGRNVNALLDSMIWDGVTALVPPYLIKIKNTAQLPKDVLAEMELLRDALIKARATFRSLRGRDVDVQLEIDQ